MHSARHSSSVKRRTAHSSQNGEHDLPRDVTAPQPKVPHNMHQGLQQQGAKGRKHKLPSGIGEHRWETYPEVDQKVSEASALQVFLCLASMDRNG